MMVYGMHQESASLHYVSEVFSRLPGRQRQPDLYMTARSAVDGAHLAAQLLHDGVDLSLIHI